MIAIGRSDVGRVRVNNQDSYGIHMDGLFPYVLVADGMGGHKAGEVASSMAVQTACDYVADHADETHADDMEKLLVQSFMYANQKIFEHANQTKDLAGMGTTLVISILQEERFWIGHIGDSRGYLWQNGTLRQITQDHSLVHELVKNGQITLEEAENHPQRHILTRALGTDEHIDVDVSEFAWSTGDILVLCSDGLTIHVSSTEIEKILKTQSSLEKKITNLMDLSLARGGHDNITIVAIENVSALPKRGDVK